MLDLTSADILAALRIEWESLLSEDRLRRLHRSDGLRTEKPASDRKPAAHGGCVMMGIVQEFRRITMDPEVMSGKPCIRGMRVTVGMIVEALAAGRSFEQLLEDFPYLEEQDIREALAFAARLAQGHEIRLAS